MLAKKSFDDLCIIGIPGYGVVMILPTTNNLRITNFLGNDEDSNVKSLRYKQDTLLKNNILTHARISMDKFSNALTLYPTKGMQGGKNANFYEFLTLGTVPYLVGSAMLMTIFNVANKFFDPFAKSRAVPFGKKMALGVLFYGIMKEFSKAFVTKPVKALTGVDTELPYAKVINELPDYVNDTDVTSIEYHKVFESLEFPRWDLLYGKESKGEIRNAYYDKIAKKLGMGENLKDSDQEVKPRIREIVAKTLAAKTISSYLWAATGVCVAFQEPWNDFFNTKGTKASFKQFFVSLKDSVKTLYKGEGSGFKKYAGKLMIGAALLSTVAGITNVICGAYKSSKFNDENIIDNNKKILVN